MVAVLTSSQPGSAERERRLGDLLSAQGVDYVVIFPEWFPRLAQDPRLVEVTRFAVPQSTALAYGSVVIYRFGSVKE